MEKEKKAARIATLQKNNNKKQEREAANKKKNDQNNGQSSAKNGRGPDDANTASDPKRKKSKAGQIRSRTNQYQQVPHQNYPKRQHFVNMQQGQQAMRQTMNPYYHQPPTMVYGQPPSNPPFPPPPRFQVFTPFSQAQNNWFQPSQGGGYQCRGHQGRSNSGRRDGRGR